MKLEILFFCVMAFLIYDTYYGGIYTKYLYSLKKYTKVISIGFLIFSVYLMLKRHPDKAPNLLRNANNFIRFLPLYRDGNSMNTYYDNPIESSLGLFNPYTDQATSRIINSGKHGTKRSVSETKKNM